MVKGGESGGIKEVSEHYKTLKKYTGLWVLLGSFAGILILCGAAAFGASMFLLVREKDNWNEQDEQNEQITTLKAQVALLQTQILGTVTMAMVRYTNGTLNKRAPTVTITPTAYKVKIIAAYLTQDISGGVAVGTQYPIYVNPQCQDDPTNCEVDTTSKLYSISTYLNLVDTSANINTALATTKTLIPVGTYKYITLVYCHKNETGLGNNVQFQAGNMTSLASYARYPCTDNVAITGGLDVTAGSQQIAYLSFDITKSVDVWDTAQTTINCVSQANQTYCLNQPVFTPVVSALA